MGGLYSSFFIGVDKMNIAICDDEREYRDILKKHINLNTD